VNRGDLPVHAGCPKVTSGDIGTGPKPSLWISQNGFRGVPASRNFLSQRRALWWGEGGETARYWGFMTGEKKMSSFSKKALAAPGLHP